MSSAIVRSTILLLAITAVAVAGCASIHRHEARDTERVLAAAGFRMRPADTPEQQADLRTMQPYRVVGRTKDGRVVYTYADPENCRCFYVGGESEYSRYEELTVKQKIAEEMEAASMNWKLWSPWWWW